MLPDLAAATSLKSLSYMIIIFRHVAKQKIYANTGPPIETTWPCRPRTIRGVIDSGLLIQITKKNYLAT